MPITKFIDIKLRSKTAERNVSSLDRKMMGLGHTADKTTKSMGALSKVAIGVFTGIALQKITKFADAFTSIQNQIRQTTKTTAELTQRTAQLLDIANRSRVEFGATAELYTQLSLSTENLNISTGDLLRLTETIGKSFAVSGKTAAESAGAIRQLGQAFSAGALRGDEFNSIAEGAPEIMRALQRSLGLTQGELRALAATGGITSKVLVDALSQAADVIDQKMSKAVKTFSQSLQEANNNMIKFVGETTLVQNVIGGAGDALVIASENMETIGKLAGLAAVVFASRLIPATTAYTAALLRVGFAQATATKATVGFSAAMGVQAARATSATVAVNALSLASRGAAVALAFIGGPLGAAVIAATALFLFVDSAESADKKALRLSKSIETLKTSFSDLTVAQRSLEIEKLSIQFRKQKAIVDSINKALDVEEKGAIAGREKNARLRDLNKQLETQSAILDDISVKQQSIFAVGLPGITGQTVDEPEVTKGESPLIARAKRETAALEAELRARQLVSEGILNEEEARLALRFDNKLAQDEVRLAADLIKLGENEEAKTTLRMLFEEQQLLNNQLFEQQLTEIQEEETDKRIEQNELELQSKVSTFQGILGAAAAFGIKSEKLNKAVRIAQGALSAYQIFAASEAAAALALAQPPGPPSTIPFAASISAAGKIKAGAVLAGAVGGALSSGGGGASVSRPSVPTVQRATPAAQEVTGQQRVVDIRIDDNALLTGSMFKEALNSILDSDSDIILNISNKQAEIDRTGGF